MDSTLQCGIGKRKCGTLLPEQQGRSKMKEEFTFLRVWFITGTSTGFRVSACRGGAETRRASNCHSPRRLKVVAFRPAISRPHSHIDARCHQPD
jgi:hypothetical protein